MATVTLGTAFSTLGAWPGQLLQADGTSIVQSPTSGGFTLLHGAGSPFAGYKVAIGGSGITYLNGVPIAGTMTSVKIVDASGALVINVTGLSGTLANDVSQFYADVFGSPNPDVGPRPDGKLAWSHLLSGNDVITGTSGNDSRTLVGLDAGNDTYNMGSGDDAVAGGIGNDSYNGGSGYDRLTFQETTYSEGGSAVGGAVFDIDAGTVKDPWGGTDRITGFEEYAGSRFADSYYGGAATTDVFTGLRGRDLIDGGANAFDLNGVALGDDHDRVSYRDDYWQGGGFGVVVNLETSVVDGSIRGTGRDGFGNTDTLIDIEDVDGTRYGDVLNGSRRSNQLAGGEGRDTYNGGESDDYIVFKTFFVNAPHGVDVDLGRSSGQIIDDGFGNAETATSIEGLIGTDANDRLKGNLANNHITGNRGADTMTGGGGTDDFHFMGDTDIGQGDTVTDFGATDSISFQRSGFAGMSATIRLVNGSAAATSVGTFIFNADNDTLYWDRDGTGAAAAVAVAVLPGVNALVVANLAVWD